MAIESIKSIKTSHCRPSEALGEHDLDKGTHLTWASTSNRILLWTKNCQFLTRTLASYASSSNFEDLSRKSDRYTIKHDRWSADITSVQEVGSNRQLTKYRIINRDTHINDVPGNSWGSNFRNSFHGRSIFKTNHRTFLFFSLSFLNSDLWNLYTRQREEEKREK